jgi:hypothetical protein
MFKIWNQSLTAPASGRGKTGSTEISKDVQELCEIIKENGEKQEDGTYYVTFRTLFDLYENISENVVRDLLRARKLKLVTFEGEMLFQGRDDKTLIQLLQGPPVKE